MADRDLVFVSYSQKDAEWLEEVELTLKPLVREGQLALWNDTQIEGAQRWEEEIEEALGRTRLAILLVTRQFVGSDFVVQSELPRFLDAAKQDGAEILPIFVKPVDFDDDDITRFSAVLPNRPSHTLIDMDEPERERFWAAFKKRVKALLSESPEPADTPTAVDVAAEQEFVYDLFLSHPSSQEATARELATALEGAGYDIFLSTWPEEPDESWLDLLGEALGPEAGTPCRGLAVFVDAGSYGPWSQNPSQDLEQRPRDLVKRLKDTKRPVMALLPLASAEPRPAAHGLHIPQLSWIRLPGSDLDRPLRLMQKMLGRTTRVIQPVDAARPAKPRVLDLDDAIGKLASKLLQTPIPFLVGRCWPDANNERDAGDAPIPRSPAAITERLLQGCHLLDEGETLPALPPPMDVAGTYFALREKDEDELGKFLSTIAGEVAGLPSPGHELLAKVLARAKHEANHLAREHRQVVLTTCSDLRLERALLRERVPFSRIVQYRKSHRNWGMPPKLVLSQVTPPEAVGEQLLVTTAEGRPSVLDPDDPELSAALDRHLQHCPKTEHTVAEPPELEKLAPLIVYKFHGSVDDPSSCLLSTDQYHRLFAELPKYLPENLTSAVINQPLVLLGASFLDPDLRMTLRSLFRDQQLFAGSYAIRTRPPEDSPDPFRRLEAKLWDELQDEIRRLGFEPMETDEGTFLSRLLEQLETLDQAAEAS